MRIVLVNPSAEQLAATFSAQVARANGNRRTRLLDEDRPARVEKVVGAESGCEEAHGGHVANAYGYPAAATGLWYAWATDRAGNKHVAIEAKEVSASKGAGVGLPFTSKTAEMFARLGLSWLVIYPHLEQYRRPDAAGLTADEAAFRKSIKAKPGDHARWLVLADWLDEQGRADDAGVIRSFLMPAGVAA
jgi:uncharacterized protein (TIGR02996 family)